jgi:plasmid maintenance system antidote protein VapI
MAMLNPPHPGETIRELCLEPLGLTVTQAAKGLGITRKSLLRDVQLLSQNQILRDVRLFILLFPI